jgi:hypothetical protein
MLDFFLLVNFFPCNVGLYSLAGGKNELEKKITLQGASYKKKYIIVGKRKTHLHCRGIKTHLP